jgi:hypothetical protein
VDGGAVTGSESPEQRAYRERVAARPGPVLDADALRAATVRISLAKMDER